ncbi:MAG: NfeD family protein [bacterium]|nr:NfeD family protein [bacterium]
MEHTALFGMLFASPWSRMGLSMFFFWLTFVALAALSISLLLGHDHDADHDMDHDADNDHDTDHDGSGNMSFISIRILLMFVAGFGAGGYFGARADYDVAGSSFFGVVGGLILAAIGYVFLNWLYRHQATSTVKTRDVIGSIAVVSIAIAPDGVGEIVCAVGDRQEWFSARTTQPTTIPIASRVRITAAMGSMLVVESAGETKQN